ncbi:hypothetical protein ACQKQD_24165 [Methylobacterium sp. NPDC080182]|uniref:hypothetical protein n=1 Tax=Methylobacterium sp. NPDC080182 TaxID=3390590 RepID=UPI003CFCA184
MNPITVLRTLSVCAVVTPLQHRERDDDWRMELLTSLYGPVRAGRTLGVHYAAVESPRQTPCLARFVQAVRRREIQAVASGIPGRLRDRVVPVRNVGALCAGRSVAHVPGGGTAEARMRANGRALCLSAIAEAEDCVAAARRARTARSRAACAEHARVALEAARHVAEDFDLGAEVVVPAYSVLAPELWCLVAPAYAREAWVTGGPVQLPDDDADALGAISW